jgi:alkanesulfonate monooxygenase SsuD/methylene tetrahydromethanopterin reductase-like flavin-dependent oxidoreductase (luciferase family)
VLVPRGPDPGRVGVYLPSIPQHDPEGAWARVRGTAEAAEQLGAGALWAVDHLFWEQPVLECLTVATVAATCTRTPLVGTAVLQLPLRHTASVAKAAASLQQLSGGRFVLGVGVGSHEGEYGAAEAEFGRRGRRLDHQLDQLATLWQPDDGRYEQRPAPAPVPLWFGGDGPHVRRRVVAHGTGWNSAFLRPKGFAAERERLRADLAAAGRDPDEVTIAATVAVRVGPKDEVVPEALGYLAGMYALDPRMFVAHVAAGEAAHCAERVQRYVEAGADHVALVVAADDPRPDLDVLLPHLAEVLG